MMVKISQWLRCDSVSAEVTRGIRESIHPILFFALVEALFCCSSCWCMGVCNIFQKCHHLPFTGIICHF